MRILSPLKTAENGPQEKESVLGEGCPELEGWLHAQLGPFLPDHDTSLFPRVLGYLTIDARSAGVAVAAVLIWRRAPIIVVILAAAATTALLRL